MSKKYSSNLLASAAGVATPPASPAPYLELTGFSPSEAANLCGVGRTFIYSAISSGELKTSKIGSRRIITLGAIRAWLQANEDVDAAN